MRKYFNNKGRIILGSLLLLVSLLLALYLILPDKADSGDYLNSFHGNATDGVNRTPASITAGHCQHCHDPHAGPTSGVTGGPFNYNLYKSRTNNAICFTAEAGSGCHNAPPTGYPAQETDRMPWNATYPHYFEKNITGTRDPGVLDRKRWPGSAVFNDTGLAGTKDASPHYKDINMPLQDAAGQGLCANCHNNPHKKGTNPYDMLRNTYIDPGPTANFNLCFGVPSDGTGYAAAICHDTGGVPSLAENKLIKGLYDNADNQAGHQIRCSTKSVVITSGACTGAGVLSGTSGLVIGDKMPCYNCHNPHGSRGSDGVNKNAYLISDQRASYWYGLTDTIATAAQMRRFCLGCHLASDDSRAAGSVTVMGIGMNKIPAITAHTAAALDNCYSCHASGITTATAYASSSSKNVHHPDIGGSCTSCHDAGGPGTTGTYTRRAIKPEFELAWGHKNSGRTGTYPLTTNDCGVCHMEGDPLTGSTTASHNNGRIELRNPDSGAVMVTFNVGEKFSRDLSSNAIEARTTEVQNFCLACHDTNGQNSGASYRVPGGTATNPWNDGATRVDVSLHFNTGNTSYHPVMGRQNNSYADANTMVAPWNTAGSPGGTKTTKTSLTNWGWLITCFDCHSRVDSPPTSMTNTVAHGGAVTLRKSITAAKGTANPLCVVCHKTTIYWGANVHSGAGSGWSGNAEARHQPGDHWGCTSCHGSDNYDTAASTRTTRAQDAHGFNTAGEFSFLRGASGSTWTWDTTNPRTTCDNMNCGTGRSDDGKTYTPGGYY